MLRILIKISFGLLLFPLVCACSKATETAHRHIRAGRITSQHGHSVIIYPEIQDSPLPQYPWPTPQQSVITAYSFHCRGSLSAKKTEQETLYDCDGLHHSLCKKFSIHPRIIDITRLLHKEYPLSIVEGFCCYKHFRFLTASGESLSTKHLSGNAALLFTEKAIRLETLRSIFSPLYKKQSIYPCSIDFTTTQTTIGNEEFRITLIPKDTGNYLSIEMLYDLETLRPIEVPPSP
ncbi:hypothetical protein [Chlamydia abortus]|uniref:hypothetical protein n=1 Tax=Chlamydia abortus TaxID=83555 RepID=UPI000A27C321|nr:hypothetical protein [Chlamydia abortus]SFV97826.1 lipoprotein [Chlamydia abortus]